jgi:large subunit ribosomal protein L24
MAMHVKKGDTVEVIAGDDKGTRGRVLNVDPRKGKVTVEGVNRVYKHVRPSRKNPQGGRIQIEKPVNISNVLPVNPKSNQATRVHFRMDVEGKKVKLASDNSEIEVIRHARR